MLRGLDEGFGVAGWDGKVRGSRRVGVWAFTLHALLLLEGLDFGMYLFRHCDVLAAIAFVVVLCCEVVLDVEKEISRTRLELRGIFLMWGRLEAEIRGKKGQTSSVAFCKEV